MPESHPGFRIFVLGAGFSRPAGLPLAMELFAEVHRSIELRYGRDTKFHKDVENYLEYRKFCDDVELEEERLDLEEFISYLDIEHFLKLRGSDTWSQEGNESQLMIRKAIGQVIHERTPPANRLPDAYYQFARLLSPHDVVITLNYDNLLERALEYVGKPYRLFPHRFKSISRHMNIIDDNVEEVTVLKLHGSIDWFDDRQFLEIKTPSVEQKDTSIPIHTVFDNPARYRAEPIVQGPYSPDDPLVHIHRIRDIDEYYSRDNGFNAPFILSPSHVKFVYADPLISFWSGLGRSGGYNLGISVIGFSLPKHDEYIRISLYQMISNYQKSWWNEKMLDVLKDRVRLVDYRANENAIDEYKERYRFVDPARTAYMFDGFGDKAIDFLFNQRRKT
jgi:hypothetical protein